MTFIIQLKYYNVSTENSIVYPSIFMVTKTVGEDQERMVLVSRESHLVQDEMIMAGQSQ